MSTQRFYASPKDTFTWPNGAVGHSPGSQLAGLGPYAKVRNCPVLVGAAAQVVHYLTCYATGYADSFYSIPAATRYQGKHVAGYFTQDEEYGGIVFCPYNRFEHLFATLAGGTPVLYPTAI